MKYQYIKEWDEFEDTDEENWDIGSSDFGYETKITIGKPTVKNKKSNVYKIVISNMHGDADHYSKKTVYEEDIKIVKKIVEFISWCSRNNESDFSRIGKRTLGEKVYDILEGDVTSGGEFYCCPSLEYVTYFDENGTEFKVNINIDTGKLRENKL